MRFRRPRHRCRSSLTVSGADLHRLDLEPPGRRGHREAEGRGLRKTLTRWRAGFRGRDGRRFRLGKGSMVGQRMAAPRLARHCCARRGLGWCGAAGRRAGTGLPPGAPRLQPGPGRSSTAAPSGSTTVAKSASRAPRFRCLRDRRRGAVRRPLPASGGTAGATHSPHCPG